MTQEPPRNDVLAERIDNLASRIGSMETRMDGLATEKTLIALIEGRDRVYNAQLKALGDDVTDLSRTLATERAERMAADRENEQRAARSRTIALTAIGIVVTVVLGMSGLLLQIGSGLA